MLKVIYELRSQCDICKLDKAKYLYRVPNGKPQQMLKAEEKDNIRNWPEKYGCDHKIKFTRTTIKDYRWDTKLNKAVKVEI